MDDLMKVTEEDLKNLFWNKQLQEIRQGKAIAFLEEKLKELGQRSADNVVEMKQANAQSVS